LEEGAFAMSSFRVRLVRIENGEEKPVPGRVVVFCFGFGKGVGETSTDEDGHASYEADYATPQTVELGIEGIFEVITLTFEDGIEQTIDVGEWQRHG
jgi:hypothetical protein